MEGESTQSLLVMSMVLQGLFFMIFISAVGLGGYFGIKRFIMSRRRKKVLSLYNEHGKDNVIILSSDIKGIPALIRVNDKKEKATRIEFL